MSFLFQLRHDTAAAWLEKNPILRTGEPGVETDTKKFKLGDGISTWTQLSYYLSEDAITAYINTVVGEASPITPEEIDEVAGQVIAELELPDLVLLWENAKA